MASQPGSEIPSLRTAKHVLNALHSAESSLDSSGDSGLEFQPPMTVKRKQRRFSISVNNLLCKSNHHRSGKIRCENNYQQQNFALNTSASRTLHDDMTR